MLRFLIAAREEVDSTQLRDDLLSMLVAGHETTGSALTWTMYLLATHPEKMAKAQVGWVQSLRQCCSRVGARCTIIVTSMLDVPAGKHAKKMVKARGRLAPLRAS